MLLQKHNFFKGSTKIVPGKHKKAAATAICRAERDVQRNGAPAGLALNQTVLCLRMMKAEACLF